MGDEIGYEIEENDKRCLDAEFVYGLGDGDFVFVLEGIYSYGTEDVVMLPITGDFARLLWMFK